MSCGEWCVYYRDKGKTSACKGCKDYEVKRSRFELPKVDIFELARRLAEKEGRDINSDREKKEV